MSIFSGEKMRTPTRMGAQSSTEDVPHLPKQIADAPPITPAQDNIFGILLTALILLSSIPLFSINMLIASIWLPITNELIGIFMAISLVEGLIYVFTFSDILTNGFGGHCP